MGERDYQTAMNALEHYITKIQELQEDEIIRGGETVALSVIQKNVENVRTLISFFAKETDIHNLVPNNFSLVNYAISHYLLDLEASKAQILNKLATKELPIDRHIFDNRMINDEIKY